MHEQSKQLGKYEQGQGASLPAKRDWRLPKEQVVMFLTLKNAKCAAAGRACPVAAMVLARITAGE